MGTHGFQTGMARRRAAAAIGAAAALAVSATVLAGVGRGSLRAESVPAVASLTVPVAPFRILDTRPDSRARRRRC